MLDKNSNYIIFTNTTPEENLNKEDIINIASEFKVLKKQYPDISFILVFKANRDGSSKGGSDWEHDVDAIMHIENRFATMEKNRFSGGSSETVKIF